MNLSPIIIHSFIQHQTPCHALRCDAVKYASFLRTNSPGLLRVRGKPVRSLYLADERHSIFESMHDDVTKTDTGQPWTGTQKKVMLDTPEEEIERDDFGLPMKKNKVFEDEKAEESEGQEESVRIDQRQVSDGSKAAEISRETPGQTEISAQEPYSQSEDEFKDAATTAVSEPHTPKPHTLETDPQRDEAGALSFEGMGGNDTVCSAAQDAQDLVVSQWSASIKAESTATEDSTQLKDPPSPAGILRRDMKTTETMAAPKRIKPNLKDIIEAQSAVKSVDYERKVGNGQGPKQEEKRQSYTNGISEFSHQHTAPKDAVEEEEEDEGWQQMPAFAPYDMYDDDDRLIAREAIESDEEDADQGLGGAGKGYTRVQLDDDVQSATSLDEETKYLFKEPNDTSAAADDEEQRDSLSQMQATKELLTEGQRIAYVGMTRLALSVMTTEADAMPHTRATKREVRMAAEAMQMWSQKMMGRLYTHMDISSAEQIMIEQLAEHGVEPSDLTPTLMQNARVKNPMANTRSSISSLNSPRPSSVFSGTTSPNPSISSPRFPREEAVPPPVPYVGQDGEDLPEVRTPSQLPNTKNIDIDLRWTVLCDLFLTLIADSVYDARSRVVLERVGKYMGIEWLDICRFEKRVTDALEMQQAAEKENWNEEEHKEHRKKMALNKRYVMMGLATVGGGLVIGLSAGLLAPVIGAGLAAGFTTIGVAGTSGFLASTGAAAIITTGAAASGGIIAVRAADRRTGAVKTFEYRPLHNNKRVNLIVTVSGWMTGKVDDVRLPYSTVDPIMGDIYSVLWEPEMLTSMGDTINILATEALTQGLQQVLGSTILIGLMSAIQLPVVLTKLAYLIDNPWTVSLDRANAAGLILADSLVDRNLGTRPITFVGYSLGSRVIFSCLKELSRKGAYGLVQNVYMFGSPIVANKEDYLRARSVVSGRFVNGYAATDWILGYLFRLTSGGIRRVAGLAPVEGIPGVENVDVTEFVPGHMSYRTAMPRLLREVGWLVESDEFAEIEDPDPENHQQRQRELINEIEEARKELDKQGKKGKLGGIFGRKKKAAQRQEWETYKESVESGQDNGGKGPQGDYGGVLFDVEAIRAEVSNDQMDVKELKSTLPPIKLDLGSSNKSTDSAVPARKTQSLDAKSMARPSPVPSPTPSRIGPRSASSPRFAPPPRLHAPQVPVYSNGNGYGSSKNLYSYGEADYRDKGEEVEMTFGDSPTRSDFHLKKENGRSIHIPEDYRHVDSNPSKAYPRPELKTSATMPVDGVTSNLPGINVDHNGWVDDMDDEDFGVEKEVEMTFA